MVWMQLWPVHNVKEHHLLIVGRSSLNWIFEHESIYARDNYVVPRLILGCLLDLGQCVPAISGPYPTASNSAGLVVQLAIVAIRSLCLSFVFLRTNKLRSRCAWLHLNKNLRKALS